jgi:poly(A) polymerase
MARDRMRTLRYPTEDIDQVSRLVELHLRFHTYKMGWTDSAVHRYVRDAGPFLDRLNDLTRSDCTTRNVARARALEKRMDELEQRISELRQREELAAIRPDLDGNEIMARLDLKPGAMVGRALAFLMELRLEEGPLSKEEAGRRLDAWWAEQSAERASRGSG